MQPSGFTLVAFCRVCSNLGSVIPHTLHKLRLRCLNGKKAIAAIPNAVEQCTSLYIAQRQVFLTKILLLINTTDVLVRSELASLSILGHEFFAVFRHGWRGQLNRNDVFQKQYFWETRKSIYNTDVVN